MKELRRPHKRFFAQAGAFLLPCLLACVLALTLVGCGKDVTLVMGSTNPGQLRDNEPVVLPTTAPGNAAQSNNKAVIDFSNSSDGYFCVKSKVPKTKVKVLVETPTGNQYQYTLLNTKKYMAFPFSEGNGTYKVGVWENIEGDRYAAVFSQNIDVTLSDEFLPFLTPSQYVYYAAGDEATTFSQELTEGATSELEAINGIYLWVAQNVTYDEEKLKTLASGYLPENTSTITTKSGICFDYAVLTVSMLRAQRVPAQLVIGYAGSSYHAWIAVHSIEDGHLSYYQFDGTEWVRMDPTFDAARDLTRDLSSSIGDGTNYQPMFYY